MKTYKSPSARATRWMGDQLGRLWARPTPSAEPRPLDLDALSPGLASLARQTRTLTLELRRRCEEARHWPEDAQELERAGSWWRELLGEGVDFSPLVNTRREVFDWIDSVEQLSEADRRRLSDLGVELERVRELLTRSAPVAEGIRGLAGLLWSIDERLHGAATVGYRGGAEAAQVRVRGRGPSFVGYAAPAVDPSREDEGEDESGDESGGEGARRRYAAILDAHRRGISRVARSYAKSPAEREDLEQDIALALWRALPSFRGESKLSTFVDRVARYCCYRALRRRGRVATDSEALARLDDPEACVETHMLRADELARLEGALAGLPDKLEAALSLHLHGMSYAEIAEQLGISEGNVSARLTRARRRLQLQLA